MLDFTQRGVRQQTAWTCGDVDDAFLVIEQNRSGAIDGAWEMIGGLLGPPNGFDYLRARSKNSGGGEGEPPARLESSHKLFSELALWTDRNHNGKSEPTELQSAIFGGLLQIDLVSRTTHTPDRWGNLITAKSVVRIRRGGSVVSRDLVSVRLRG
jgi:hypothetical protein